MLHYRSRLAMTIAATLVAAGSSSGQIPGSSPAAASHPLPNRVLIVLSDRSLSRAEQDDFDQAVVLHQLGLAQLGEQLAVAVVFYASDVRVVGANGGPTPAIGSIRAELARAWTKPDGATAMVAALEKVLGMVRTFPAGADVTVLNLTDGTPDAGRLKPDEFPDIKAAVDRAMTDVQAKYRDFPPAKIQKYLSERFLELSDATTADGKELRMRQLHAEFEKAKKLFGALKAANVRVVTVDYKGLAALRDLHDAAGKPEDYVVVRQTAKLFPQIHDRHIARLARVVSLPPHRLEPDPAAFEKAVAVGGDALADRMAVTVSFDNPIPDFDAHATLEARVGGRVITLTTANDDPAAVLSRDGGGRVDAVHLLLEEVSSAGVAITFRSPKGKVSWPGATVYAHLRVAEDARVDFRPRLARPDAAPPFVVPTRYAAVWGLSAAAKGDTSPYPLRGAEVVLRHARTGAEVPLACTPDPDLKGAFRTEAKAIPPGVYDAEMHLVLASGVRAALTLPRHVESADAAEYLTLDFPLPPLDRASASRAYPDAGRIGDTRPEGVVELTVRSPLDYPVELQATVAGLTDARGTAPTGSWVTLRPARFTLQPGRAQKLLLTVKPPARIESEIADGPFRGSLILVRTDRGDSMTLKRFQEVSGGNPDSPVDAIGFELKRATLTVRAPRLLVGDELQLDPSGTRSLHVHNDLSRPFTRSVRFAVSHDSEAERAVTVRALSSFRDRNERSVPSVRLVAVGDGSPVTVSSGVKAAFDFRLEIDDDPSLGPVIGEVEVASPGLTPVVLSVEVLPRAALLGLEVRFALGALAGVAGLGAAITFVRYRRHRRLSPGRMVTATPAGPLAGILNVAVKPGGRVEVTTAVPLLCGTSDDARPRPMLADRPLPLAPGRPAGDLVLSEPTADGSEGWRVAVVDVHADPPSAIVEILDAPEHVRAARAARWRSRWLALLAAGSLFVTVYFHEPGVLAGLQWACDLIRHSI